MGLVLDAGDMDKEATTPHTIVVGVDGSDDGRRAVNWAAGQATLEHITLTLLHAVPPVEALASSYLMGAGVDPIALEEESLTAARTALEAEVERVLRTHSSLTVKTVVVHRDPRDALLAASLTASLVVVGSRGLGMFTSVLLGSVSLAVTREAACPVVVVRPGGEPRRPGVLVGADGTASSVAVLEFAFRQASLRGVPLTVAHCFWDAVVVGDGIRREATDELAHEDLRMLMAESVSGLGEKFPDVQVHTDLLRGLVDASLGEAAESHDLVVIGCHHRPNLSRLIWGSVATTVVERAHGPVAVVPQQ